LRAKKIFVSLLSIVLAFGVIGGSLFARSGTASASDPGLTAELWTMAEIDLTSSTTYGNPFLDVEVTATFVGPNGEVIVRPGFWDGGDSWKVRFAPTAVGVWQYNITSSDPANNGLKRTGTLTAVPYSGDKEIYERGFLGVSADGSHLAYADGTPFFWLGDTHWFFAEKESWDTSNKPDTTSQFKSIVDRRVQQKFTVYQSVIFGPQQSFWASGAEGTQINPDYFKNELDRKMAYIAESGLVNAFGVGFHSNIDGFVQGSERLAAYVVARYGAYPMIWFTSGEGAGYDIGPREARIDGWRQVAKAINKADAYNHPQTAHTTGLTEKESLGLPQFYEGEGWFDFEMFQGGHQKMVPTGDYDYYRTQYNLPFLESEANYEQIFNGWATDTIVRQSAYRSIQAGGIGFGYGAHGIWNASWDDDDTGADFGYGHRNWYDAIDFIGGYQMAHMIDFYRALPWERMKYRPSGWASWSGEFTAELTDPVVRADDEADAVTVYFNAGSSSQGTLSQLDASAEYESQWFNPRTGAFSAISSSFTPTGGTWTVPEKPDGQDWLLLVRKLTPTGQPIAPAALTTLVSQGKTASASSINQGTLVPADAAFDGDEGTFWTASGGQFPQWLQVDLGKPYELARIEQTFYNLNEWNYKLEGSLDGQAWFGLIDRTGAAVHGTKFVEYVSGTARYVRLTITDSSNDWASSKELKVYAKINAAAALRSTAYLVDDRELTISKVPTGTPLQDFIGNVVPSLNGQLRIYQADGVTEAAQGGIGNGMIAAVTSEDGATTRSYTIHTVSNKGINLARNATVAVSSVENSYYAAANINDGNNDTLTWSGWAAKEFPAWVELDFGEGKQFNRVDLFTKKNYEQKEYTMQAWNGADWVNLFPTVTDNTADHRAHVFEPVTSSKLRVWMTRGNVQQDTDPAEGIPGEKVARINELEVYMSPGDKLIEQLTVQGAGGAHEIASAGGTLQMTALALPADASDLTFAWSVTGTDNLPTTLATISKGGLLTAKKNGTVKVTAAAKDGSAVTASALITITGQDTSQPQTELLSLNKPVQASSVNGPAAGATDGDESTAWIAADGTFPQWIVVDLEQMYQIDRIEQSFFNEDQWKYIIEGSADGSTWTEWVSRTSNEQFISSFAHDVNQTARYVKLTIVGAKAEWPSWASSKEFAVYGKQIIPVDYGDLLSLNKPVQASSVNGPAAGATDGDESTAWIAADGTFPQWIVVDLGQTAQIKRVEQIFNNEDQWKYKLEGSLDNSNWTEWVDRTDNAASLVGFTHDVEQTARYVKLTFTGAKAEWPNWASSKEFAIYGEFIPVDPGNGSGNGNGNGTGNSGTGTGGQSTSPAWIVGADGNAELTLERPSGETTVYRIEADQLAQGFAKTQPAGTGGAAIAVIKLAPVAGAAAYTLELPAASLSEGDTGHKLEIVTPLGKLTIPAHVLAGSEWSSANRIGVTITVNGSQTALQWTADGQPIPFHAPILMALPVPGAIRNAADSGLVVVCRIDAAGRTAALPMSRYHAASGEVRFSANDQYSYETIAVNKQFNDIGDRRWMLEPIYSLAARDIIRGVGGGASFSPDAHVGRADFLLMLMRLIDAVPAEEQNFADVKPGAYYYDAVGAAKSLGIAKGSVYNTFNPAEAISRQDMMVLIDRVLHATGLAAQLPGVDGENLRSYEDAGQLSSYAKASAERLTALGVIEGDNKRLNPRGTLTRAEAAAAVYRTMKLLEEHLLP